MISSLLLIALIGIVLGIARAFLLQRIIAPPPQVFISYRRADTEGASNELMRYLASKFGIASVFLDTARIVPGDKFPESIAIRLRYSDVIIAMIGMNWESTSDGGNRRIDQDDDWVKEEIRLW